MFRLSVRAPHCIDKTAKCPESLCPVSALPLLEDVRSIPARTLLPGRRSYGLIRQSHLALLAFGLGLVQEVFAGCYQPLLPTGSSRRYLCESFLGCLVPCDGGTTECFYLFLPPCHRPSPCSDGSASRNCPRIRLLAGSIFAAADMP